MRSDLKRRLVGLEKAAGPDLHSVKSALTRAELRGTVGIAGLLAKVCGDKDPQGAADARKRQQEAEAALAAIPDTEELRRSDEKLLAPLRAKEPGGVSGFLGMTSKH